MKNNFTYLKEAFRELGEMGSILPSSRFAAEAMIDQVPQSEGISVLEVGSGTGSFTEPLMQRLGSQDRLVLIEINPRLANLLREKTQEWGSEESRPKVEIFEGDILDYSAENPFDAMVSAIPLNNISPAIVGDIIEKQRELLKPGAPLAYIEYMGLWNLRKLVLFHKLDRWHEHEQQMQALRGSTDAMKKVWRNLPPAVIRYHRFIDDEQNHAKA